MAVSPNLRNRPESQSAGIQIKEDRALAGRGARGGKRRGNGKNDTPEPDIPAPQAAAADKVTRDELIHHIESPPEPPHPPTANTTDQQCMKNLEDVRALIPLRRGYEKIKMDITNIMWRSGPRYEEQEMKNLQEQLRKELITTTARFQAGLAGKGSHSWQCEYLNFNNRACKDSDACWKRKFGEIVQKARTTNDWDDFLREFETNVIFIISKWSVYVKYGSKAFPTHCLEMIKQFIRDHWPKIDMDQMSENRKSRFRAQVRDEVCFRCGVTVVEVQDYLRRFMWAFRHENERHEPWDKFLTNYGYKVPCVWLSDAEKEIIRRQTLWNPYQPYFTKNEKNRWTGRTGIAWKHAENFQKIFLYELEKLPENMDHPFFVELREKKVAMARDQELLPHLPPEVVDEILLPREEVIDKEREDEIERSLARQGISRVPGEGLSVGHPFLRGA